MSDSDAEAPSQGYWPSVADLFLTLFIIAVAIIAVVFRVLLPANNVGKDQALVHAVGNDLVKVRTPVNKLRVALELEPVPAGARASEVIAALAETCDAAIAKIEELRAAIKESEEQLSRILESPDAQTEMRRLLAENRELTARLNNLLRTLGEDPDGVRKMIKEIEDLRRQLHDRPPNIQISEQKEAYRFESGSSAMGSAFVEGLRQNEFARLAREIIERESEGRVKVDTLEIIGHTDGVPLATSGNLDLKLPEVLAGPRTETSGLTPGSNNDLGLLRALAVRQQWETFVDIHPQSEILHRIQIRCYSAGQTIIPESGGATTTDDFRKANPLARRIEMRLTRLLDQ